MISPGRGGGGHQTTLCRRQPIHGVGRNRGPEPQRQDTACGIVDLQALHTARGCYLEPYMVYILDMERASTQPDVDAIVRGYRLQRLFLCLDTPVPIQGREPATMLECEPLQKCPAILERDIAKAHTLTFLAD